METTIYMYNYIGVIFRVKGLVIQLFRVLWLMDASPASLGLGCPHV